MKVTTVSVSVRYSKAMEDGSHKTVELSAEAAVDSALTWQQAQANLYQELGQQLEALWTTQANGQPVKGSRPNGLANGGNDNSGHYCQDHGVAFKRFEKDGRAWYSHKTGDNWCNERSECDLACPTLYILPLPPDLNRADIPHAGSRS